MAKVIKVDDAVGEVLLHDITGVIPEKGFKGRRFLGKGTPSLKLGGILGGLL